MLLFYSKSHEDSSCHSEQMPNGQQALSESLTSSPSLPAAHGILASSLFPELTGTLLPWGYNAGHSALPRMSAGRCLRLCPSDCPALLLTPLSDFLHTWESNADWQVEGLWSIHAGAQPPFIEGLPPLLVSLETFPFGQHTVAVGRVKTEKVRKPHLFQRPWPGSNAAHFQIPLVITNHMAPSGYKGDVLYNLVIYVQEEKENLDISEYS